MKRTCCPVAPDDIKMIFSSMEFHLALKNKLIYK